MKILSNVSPVSLALLIDVNFFLDSETDSRLKQKVATKHHTSLELLQITCGHCFYFNEAKQLICPYPIPYKYFLMQMHCKVKGKTSIAIHIIIIQLSDILSQFTSCQLEYVEGFQTGFWRNQIVQNYIWHFWGSSL